MKRKLILLSLPLLFIGCGKKKSYKDIPPAVQNRTVYESAKDLIAKELKSPSTARFPSYEMVSVVNEIGVTYSISGFVDSENGFGATVRSNYKAKVNYTESYVSLAEITWD